MNHSENDVGNYIKSLIDCGATMEIFQEFIGPTQTFKTVLVYQGDRKMILHDRPLPFILQANGQIIDDVMLPKRMRYYHPS